MRAPNFKECPKGHKLPHEGCTPLYCRDAPTKGVAPSPLKALGKAPPARRKPKSGIAAEQEKAVEKVLAAVPQGADRQNETLDEFKRKQAEKIGKRVAERAMRLALVKMPEGLSGAEAEEWADKKTLELLPVAIAQIEYDLLYGDDGQRREAARDILDMTGRRRRDAAGAAPPTIVLNLGGSSLMPWEKNEKVTTGTATRIEAQKAPADGDGPPRLGEAHGGRDKASG